MKIQILCQGTSKHSTVDSEDVLTQIAFIRRELQGLGHEVIFCDAVGYDLSIAEKLIRYSNPDIVFNMVEDIGGRNCLNPIGAMILEDIGIPFTGSPSVTLALTTNKLAAKSIMKMAGIQTPQCFTAKEVLSGVVKTHANFIIKPVCEDASVGIDYSSVCSGAELRERFEALGTDANKYFAEVFIDGKEIYVSLLYDPIVKELEVLPPAEIVYIDHPAGIPEIMTYDAKWNSEHCSYRHDDIPVKTGTALHEQIVRTAKHTAKAFGLKGYARIDVRVGYGTIFVIDVNANPHIGEESYMIDAANKAGIDKSRFFEYILEDCNGK